MAVIVTDVDGTLLVHGKTDPGSIAILKKLQERHHLILATGRDQESVRFLVEKLDMEHYKTGALILLNGMEMIDFRDREHIKKPGLSCEQTLSAIKALKKYCLQVYVVGEGTHWRIPSVFEPLFHLVPIKKVKKVLSRPRIEHLPSSIDKIAILGYFGTKRRLMNLERSENLSYIKIGKFWDEIVPEGCDKAKMVERYMCKYHIPFDDLYVFGDGQNDAAMLQLTGNSYAPKNALPCAKKAARHVFEPGSMAKVAYSELHARHDLHGQKHRKEQQDH